MSEDPVLSGALAAAYVLGVQAGGVAATPKHYIANDFETDRFNVDVIVDDRTMRESDDGAAIGGLVIRYDEESHYEVELHDAEVVARASLPSLCTEHRLPRPTGEVLLWIETRPGDGGYAERMTSDWITMGFDSGGVRTELGRFDGRYLTAETTCSFTGRVAGVYCEQGVLTVCSFSETGL